MEGTNVALLSTLRAIVSGTGKAARKGPLGELADANASDSTRLAAIEKMLSRHLPVFMNASASVPAFGGKLNQLERRIEQAESHIHAAWERIEFARKEILLEIAHGEIKALSRKNPGQILAAAKVKEALEDDTLRLNLGCGHIVRKDYINIDKRDLPGVDIVADIDNLPFEAGSAREITSSHLLEHFPQEALSRRLLPYWKSLLRPGGTFSAVTPDAEAMLAGAAKGTYLFEDFRTVLFGAQDYIGDYHYNLFTPDTLAKTLHEAGFCNIKTLVKGRRNGQCFEFETQAERSLTDV